MKTSHTPGDWGIAIVDCGKSDSEVATIVDGVMVSIASVFSETTYTEMMPSGEGAHYKVSKAESESNAKLISAAPDLLAALLEIVSAADSEGWVNLDAGFAKARSAINKATKG